MRRPKTRQWNFSTLYGGSTLLTTMWIHLTVSSQTSHLGRLPADMTLRETYEDEHISCFDLFIEWNALCRISHSGLDGETYRTMIAREFKARGIKERLQIYRKIPSAADKSEITSSWSSFDGKMLSNIVLRANEIVYKPLRKWDREADRKVDHYVFDVGIVREQPIPREISLQPELEAELPFSETFSTHEYDRNESSDLNDDYEEIVIPDSDNNDLLSETTVTTIQSSIL